MLNPGAWLGPPANAFQRRQSMASIILIIVMLRVGECIAKGTTIGVVLNNGPRARESLRQDSRALGPLFNTISIVL